MAEDGPPAPRGLAGDAGGCSQGTVPQPHITSCSGAAAPPGSLRDYTVCTANRCRNTGPETVREQLAANESSQISCRTLVSHSNCNCCFSVSYSSQDPQKTLYQHNKLVVADCHVCALESRGALKRSLERLSARHEVGEAPGVTGRAGAAAPGPAQPQAGAPVSHQQSACFPLPFTVFSPYCCLPLPLLVQLLCKGCSSPAPCCSNSCGSGSSRNPVLLLTADDRQGTQKLHFTGNSSSLFTASSVESLWDLEH